MVQIVMQLSAPSRITSYSNSFQPRTDSSTSTCLIREYARPSPTIRSSSSALCATPLPLPPSVYAARTIRSEEHTSELQSQSNLVCRLLLEKKKLYDTS